MLMSAALGSAWPLGWLCVKITLVALCARAALTISRGHTGALLNVPRNGSSDAISSARVQVHDAEHLVLQTAVQPQLQELAHELRRIHRLATPDLLQNDLACRGEDFFWLKLDMAH